MESSIRRDSKSDSTPHSYHSKPHQTNTTSAPPKHYSSSSSSTLPPWLGIEGKLGGFAIEEPKAQIRPLNSRIELIRGGNLILKLILILVVLKL